MRELDSYLNDHLAGSVGALELVDHWSELYDGRPLAKFLSALRKDIKADQKTLRELMRALGTKESSVRPAGAWVAEKLSRARFAVASDDAGGLGLVLALETMVMGITGKKLLWRALAASDLPRKANIDFVEMENALRNKSHESSLSVSAPRATPCPATARDNSATVQSS